MIIDVFNVLKKYDLSESDVPKIELTLVQSQAQINENGNQFSEYPAINILTETLFDYILIPPVNFSLVEEILERNRLFNDWIKMQYENEATIYFIGNSISFAAYSGFLIHQEVKVSGVSDDFFDLFPKIKKGNGHFYQKIDRIVLSCDGIRTLYAVFDLIQSYYQKSFVVRLAKIYKVDLNWVECRHYDEFRFVYETGDERLDNILKKIHSNYFQIKNIQDVLDEFAESRRTFNRIFLQELKMTPIEYLQGVRISYARLFLETTELNIEEIASKVGYEDPKSFRLIFFRQVGISPLDYRKRFTFPL
ncbi:MAG: helix-turn-helix domain-containing protein [Chitinophagales bacterium]|nr:helix-turn-helix domain-containing protein [Chitinophagales bacterium]